MIMFKMSYIFLIFQNEHWNAVKTILQISKSLNCATGNNKIRMDLRSKGGSRFTVVFGSLSETNFHDVLLYGFVKSERTKQVTLWNGRVKVTYYLPVVFGYLRNKLTINIIMSISTLLFETQTSSFHCAR